MVIETGGVGITAGALRAHLTVPLDGNRADQDVIAAAIERLEVALGCGAQTVD